MNKRKRPSLMIIALCLVFIYFSYLAIEQQRILDVRNNEIAKIEEKIEAEKRVNEELKKEIEMIDSDEYKEKIAREKLGMVRKNERVFVDVGN